MLKCEKRTKKISTRTEHNLLYNTFNSRPFSENKYKKVKHFVTCKPKLVCSTLCMKL